MIKISFLRFKTRPVKVKNLVIGGDNPVVVQTMCTEYTENVPAVVEQIIALHQAGAELIRITVPSLKDAEHVAEIKKLLKKKYQDVPLVADVHHFGSDIAIKTAEVMDKIRINPGLFVFKKPSGKLEYSKTEIEAELAEIEKALLPVLATCKKHGTAMRIGVNHGSLSERLKIMYGDTPQGMVESAMEYLKICQRNHFQELVISLKASKVKVMIEANRLMVQRMVEEGMNYPLHLGVTEAGAGQMGRVKGVVGIGTLLAEGIGDTIRVSLSEDPINELSVCYDLLQSLGLRRTKLELIGCPTCGRTRFDLPPMLAKVETEFGHLSNLSIAVMGCIVNGPGEMADADYGMMGQEEKTVTIFRGQTLIKPNVPQDQALTVLKELIQADGKWIETNKE
ncbi:MAG: 4-hydroxy-3-methylbut-2-en-1-yl diphosphate synthase [Candidatus Daviesbacteria bacterium GW2011_GWA1_41_61]|uniref:4-hydroxy-3-methylbut-2-en-1-yl diphosphate synthase (flavodoxin) n=1 Tax=Candidatus Daviesbacteria bacterium GW2011_GWA2_40_9 TaxID=1618424 RepID=A0A0G0WHC8_9BACT|nr:MAG: 4-hydroxy-3-methylbut-2-en-1-yl diphosphate synthase [Candidatus Daviesbacteria bacterium GW2011_GWC1_40_9]KKR83730.1 MAG: 4-hydroxy-3-methylbut-2-en-1-yl diphosphate synthase [Candidatus Daviesbacteria bacterium GW2011_GWA2_40_9]KKR93675.1 MAG: 4-hydroxy-3-methylbut-2-en-1-yl diphosphate synthase [Candidatus Daviesbacteria bacterium GW2011_GWB1_41_15]KKS15141.1 MAG: 4-hydroxy-3-methylbut-2-en-1-yl diphosphate synthase [Candidatus Daviesbacteria bacterium GW2011_GWA1_41_61]